MNQAIEKVRKIDKFKVGFGIFLVLVFLCVSVYVTIFSIGKDNNLVVSILDIGQGDSIYIKAPNGKEIIIDGGPDQKLLSELGSVMPFFDKTIDMIVVTNPDKDHYAGFIDMLDRYKVKQLLEPGTISTTPTYHAFKEKVKQKNIEEVLARRGMKIVLDEKRNIYLEILFPDKDVSGFSTNDGSIVSRLVYGNTSILLQGDSPKEIEQYLVHTYGKESVRADILKAGHHGSRTSTSKEYLDAVLPKVVLISCGKDNRYGHPHKEVLENLKEAGVETHRTDLEGRVTFVSNGFEWERK